MINPTNPHTELLKEWEIARDYPIFCIDGILIEGEWLKSSPKILFY
jgi:hypothetical protein